MDRFETEERPSALSEWHRGYPEARIAGVCAGLSAHFDVPLTLVRVGFILGALLGPSIVLVVGTYLALWFLMPEAPGEESGLDRISEAVNRLSGEARDRLERSDTDFR